jgi:hypothetical protein
MLFGIFTIFFAPMKKHTFITLATIAVVLFSSSLQAQVVHQYWQAMGGMTSGSTNNITIDSMNRVYVCTGGDGVMQSTDGGVHWHGFNRGLRVLPFQALESSTIESSTVAYVYGLSQRNEVMRRLFNSDVSDVSWEYMSNIGRSVRDTSHDRSPGHKPLLDTTYANTLTVNQILTNRKGYVYLATSNFGVLRSRDHGDNWDRPEGLNNLPQPDTVVLALAINRKNQTLFALSDSNGTTNPYKYVRHISYSTDDGTTWSRLPSIPPDSEYALNLLIADDGSILVGYYVQYCDSAHGYACDSTRIFRSSNMGKSWDRVLDLPISRETNADALFHDRNTNIIYANIHGPTYRSTDNGATWQPRNLEKMGEETFHCVVDTLGRVFQCAIPDAVFRSDDGAMTFQDMNAHLAVQHLDGGIAIDSFGRIFSMSQFNMYRNSHGGLGGDAWFNFPYELDETNFPFFSIDRDNRLFYGSYWGLFRSTDTSDITFDTIIKSHPDLRYSNHAYDATNQIYYHGVNMKTNEIFVSSQKDPLGNPFVSYWFAKSTDHGNTWIRLNNTSELSGAEQIGAFDFSTSRSSVFDTIYASSNTSNVIYRSINDGTNWQVICNDSNISNIYQILCYPDGSVFRLQGSGGPYSGLYRSFDGGVTWNKVFPPDGVTIPEYSQVKPLCLDRKGRILINTYNYAPGGTEPDSSTHNGFYLSQNADFTQWKNVSTGFWGDDWDTDRYLNCSQVAQDPRTGLYYANSRGRSVFVSTVPDLEYEGLAGVPSFPLSPTIGGLQNYPNPFGQTTQITYDVPNSGSIKVSVYDVLGRQLKVIANGYMESGQHTVSFDSRVVQSSGQYLLVLESSSGVTSHWMTVTK